MMSEDDIQKTDAFADEQELCDEVEIDKFVLWFCKCTVFTVLPALPDNTSISSC